MSPQLDALYDSALALSPAERAELAQRLLASVAPPGALEEGTEALAAELERRSAAYDRGELTASAWYPSIVASPDVCGGDARLVRTRIAVWTLEALRQQGASDSEILGAFPSLSMKDLRQAWSYVADHRAEIVAAIRDNQGD